MGTLLVIPWFKADAWEIPIPGIGTLPVQPFGILVAVGVLLAVRVHEEFAKKNGIRPQVVADHATHVMVGGFLGAYFGNRLMYDPDKYHQILPYLKIVGALVLALGLVQLLLWALARNGRPLGESVAGLLRFAALIPAAWIGYQEFQAGTLEYLGLSSYGGFFGSILGLLVWKLRRGFSMVAVGDGALFAFPIGWAFGRTGCFITHDHPGKVSDFFLAVDNYNLQGQPRHDLGLYEVFWSVAVTGLFFFLARKRRRRGFYMGLICILYAPVRFFLDFLRAEPDLGGDIRYFMLTPGQWSSFALLAVGLGVWWWIYRHDEVQVAPGAQWPIPEDEEDDRVASRPKGAPKKTRRAAPGKTGSKSAAGTGPRKFATSKSPASKGGASKSSESKSPESKGGTSTPKKKTKKKAAADASDRADVDQSSPPDSAGDADDSIASDNETR
jgi:prolipoprotein diacylglyceryltransferase